MKHDMVTFHYCLTKKQLIWFEHCYMLRDNFQIILFIYYIFHLFFSNSFHFLWEKNLFLLWGRNHLLYCLYVECFFSLWSIQFQALLSIHSMWGWNCKFQYLAVWKLMVSSSNKYSLSATTWPNTGPVLYIDYNLDTPNKIKFSTLHHGFIRLGEMQG